LDLQWEATGELASASGTDEYQAGDCTVQLASAYSRRATPATGTVSAGSTNFAPGDSIAASIATSSYSTSVTCPE